jgi:hypothetical protein
MSALIAISEAVRNIGLLIVAVFGLYLAWLRVTAANRQAEATLSQADLARRAHVAELFNRAVGQLTDAKLEVRLGAIYTLRQIASDFPDLAEPTFDLLSTYLRETAGQYKDDLPPGDVREIMKTLVDHMVDNEPDRTRST